jgi:uncharacterized membrane protein YvlD (DUF360 family)
MWGDLPKDQKKRLNFLAFGYFPVLIAIAFVLGAWVANFAQLRVDKFGVILAIVCCTVIYLICVRTAYRKVAQKTKRNKIL